MTEISFHDRPRGAPILRTHGGEVVRNVAVEEDGEVVDVTEMRLQYEDDHQHHVRFGDILSKRGSLTYEEALGALRLLEGTAVDIYAEPGEAGRPISKQMLVGEAQGRAVALEKSWSFAIDCEGPAYVASATFSGGALAAQLRPEKFGAAVIDDSGLVAIELADGGPLFYFVPRDGEDRPPIHRPPSADAAGQTVAVGWQE